MKNSNSKLIANVKKYITLCIREVQVISETQKEIDWNNSHKACFFLSKICTSINNLTRQKNFNGWFISIWILSELFRSLFVDPFNGSIIDPVTQLWRLYGNNFISIFREWCSNILSYLSFFITVSANFSD